MPTHCGDIYECAASFAGEGADEPPRFSTFLEQTHARAKLPLAEALPISKWAILKVKDNKEISRWAVLPGQPRRLSELSTASN